MKEIIKNWIAEVYFQFYGRKLKNQRLNVMSIDETIDELIDKQCSLIRFGDGELNLIGGNSITFQDYDKSLADQLMQVIAMDHDKILVCIPDIFGELNMYTVRSQKFWKEHLLFYRKKYYKYCRKDYVYGNAFISRCYYMIDDKEKCKTWFEKIRKVWENKKIVVVEGDVSRNGLENDLFNNVMSLERIICPSKNAYYVYEKIRTICHSYTKDTLFLLSIGAVSKILVKDLVDNGYRAIDIGNLDMEYYWFCEKVDYKKHPPKRNYTVDNADQNEDFLKYLSEIKFVVK